MTVNEVLIPSSLLIINMKLKNEGQIHCCFVFLNIYIWIHSIICLWDDWYEWHLKIIFNIDQSNYLYMCVVHHQNYLG